MTQPPVFEWATSTGGLVVGGLTLTAAQWIENQVSGNVTYGLVDYTASGSPDLSGVAESHRLDVSDFANALNNGVHYIVSANNATKKIRVRMTARTDATADETGASAAADVYDLGALNQEPSAQKQAQGYIPGEKPNAQQLNWMLNLLSKWTDYLTNDSPGLIVTADLTELAAVDTTGFVERGAVSEADGLYTWVPGNALPVSSPTVIDSDVDGQWVQRLSAASVQNVASGPGIDVQISGGTATVSAIEALRTNYAEVTQSGHGFAVRNIVRHNGTSWVKAQGNSVGNCTDVWFVSAVAGDDFTVVKEGRVTSASHGLTPGTLYYLSASSAGAITTTKPVGSTTLPLGFHLPVIFVESSSVLHILGQSFPTFDRLLAEYVHSGTAASSVTFTNLSATAIGDVIEFEFTMGTNTNGGAASLELQINGVTSGYTSGIIRDDGSTLARVTGATSAITVSSLPTISAFDNPLRANGAASVARSNQSSTLSVIGNFMAGNAGVVHGTYAGRSGTNAANITTMLFRGQNAEFRNAQTHYVRLYRGKTQ